MIKIGIVTVYNSFNCGSRLQAFALEKILMDHGFYVAFLNTNRENHLWNDIKTGIKDIIRFRLKKAIFQFQRVFIYSQNSCKNIITRQQNIKVDLYILGSDEIWNLSRKVMQHPEFWGYGLSAPCIAYAPSINTSDYSIIDSFSFTKVSLEAMCAISVRDEHSCKELCKISDKKITVVCDPTMLIGYDEWRNYENECPYDNFILVYSYITKAISAVDIDNIKLFAKKKGKLLISILQYLSWCDINVAASKNDFLGFFAKAEYVITSTFHGTIFSLIYKKQFASYAGSNIKVLEILDQFNLHNQNASIFDLDSIFAKKINQDMLQIKIEKLRQFSLRWLLDNIYSVQL
jgi:hypothetical protein